MDSTLQVPTAAGDQLESAGGTYIQSRRGEIGLYTVAQTVKLWSSLSAMCQSLTWPQKLDKSMTEKSVAEALKHNT